MRSRGITPCNAASCTPGMLITAWDVVTRLVPVDDAAIRLELNRNLCRCTGYMGSVAAVRTVARQCRERSAGGRERPRAVAWRESDVQAATPGRWTGGLERVSRGS